MRRDGSDSQAGRGILEAEMSRAEASEASRGRHLAELVAAHETRLAHALTNRHLGSRPVAALTSTWSTDSRDDYRENYIRPLLKLLAGCLASENPEWHAIYIDERLRYLADEGRVATAHGTDTGSLIEPLVALDEDEIVGVCPDADVALDMRGALEALHEPLREHSAHRVHLLMVGDCLMNELRAFAMAEARSRGVRLKARHLYFSAREGVGLTTDEVQEAVRRQPPDLIALSFLTFEGIPAYRAFLLSSKRRVPELRRDLDRMVMVMHDFIQRLREFSSATVLLHGACGLPLTRYRRHIPALPALSHRRRQLLLELNERVRELAAGTENVVFIDEQQLCAPTGLRYAGASVVPVRTIPTAKFHTSHLGQLLAPAYGRIAAARAMMRGAKALLIDFDNTLWQGVMAEGEVAHDHGRQRLLRQLREAGVLLVSLSKNSPDAIRWEEMELAPRTSSCTRSAGITRLNPCAMRQSSSTLAWIPSS